MKVKDIMMTAQERISEAVLVAQHEDQTLAGFQHEDLCAVVDAVQRLDEGDGAGALYENLDELFADLGI